MLKNSNSQSQKRFSESIGSLFHPSDKNNSDVIFLCSSTDIGVERNGGRNGARFAPKSLLSHFKKLNLNSKWSNCRLFSTEISNEELERKDFIQSQEVESEKMLSYLNLQTTATIHIGGGHDHVFPLLKAIGTKYKKIAVINIDAHADTRIDDEAHSGNPFRKFAETFDGSFELYQIGLQEFANSKSTLGKLPRGKMEILWRNELENEDSLKNFFNKIQIDSDTAVIFSLDCDAISGHEVPGVSAVNGYGISVNDLRRIWKYFGTLRISHRPIIGIYELNPVFDTISMQSMRTISSFLYDII